ncbi:MAG: CHAT domain-containing protein [Pseudomonadaceae bacterium]|nr:CHAT domain-containing protein [Pseudomonadaceae bacterium]
MLTSPICRSVLFTVCLILTATISSNVSAVDRAAGIAHASTVRSAAKPEDQASCSAHNSPRAQLPFEGQIPGAGLCIDATSLQENANGDHIIYLIEREQNARIVQPSLASRGQERGSDSGHQGFGIEVVTAAQLPVLVRADHGYGDVSVAAISNSHPYHRSLAALSTIIRRSTGRASRDHTAEELEPLRQQIDFLSLSDELRGRARAVLASAALTRSDYTAAERWAEPRADNDARSNRWLGIIAFEAAAARGATEVARAALCRALAAPPHCRAQDASPESLLSGIAANRLGLLAHRSGRLNEARAWYGHAIDLYAGRSPRGEAIANQNIGGIESTRGNFQQAVQHFSASAARYRENNWYGPLANTLRNLAAANSSRGDFGSASENLLESLRAAEEAQQPKAQVSTLVHLAELMRRLGRLTEAEGYASQARALLGDHNWLSHRASWAIVSGRINQAQGNNDAAIKRLTEALKDYKTLGNPWSITSTLLALARTHSGNDNAAAQQHANAALTIARQHGYSRHESEALLLSGIAARRAGEHIQAETLLTQTLTLQDDTLDLLGGFETRLELAELAMSRADWQTAISWLEEAQPLADASANTIARADDRAFFANNLRRADRLHIRALLNSEQPQAALNLVLSRFGRASLLADAAGESQIEPQLRDALAKQAAELHRASGSGTLASGNPELKNRIRRLILEMSNQQEELAATLPTAQELMDALPTNSVYLHLVPDNDHSHQWIVRNNKISYRALPGVEDLSQSITQLREAIRRRGDISIQRQQLSDALLPELTGNEVIYLAAEGVFAGLPMALLGSQRYLIEEHRIVTLTNAALLTEPRSDVASYDANARVTVFADPVFGGMDMRMPRTNPAATASPGELSRLPFTALEAAAIRRLSSAAQILTGFDATREALLDPALANQDVLHIAAHGLLDEQLPEASGLYLSAVNVSGEQQNALVTLVDLYQTQFPQKLIVLSACDTAAGAQLAGESGLSLARAFLRQGSRQVIATQWPVADATSAKLFESFYRNLLVSKRPASHALQEAQLSILSEPRTRHPYFWAGYALAGPD